MQALDSSSQNCVNLSYSSFDKIGNQEFIRVSGSQHLHQIESLYHDTYEEVQKLFKMKSSQNITKKKIAGKKTITSRRIINGLNTLMANNTLQIQSKAGAVEIARSLNAVTTMVRLQVYKTEDYGEIFNKIPQEIIQLIFMPPDNAYPQTSHHQKKITLETVNLLYVNKSVNKLFLIAPVGLYLNCFRNKSNDSHLEKLNYNFLNLKDLCLYGTNTTDAGLVKLKSCKNLTSLNLGSCDEITGAKFELKYFPYLIKLDLSYTKDFTEAGLAPLKDFTNLTWLDLCKCAAVTDIGLEHLNGLKLGCLDLSWGSMTSKGLVSCLKSLTNLTALKFENCFHLESWGGTSFEDQRTINHDIYLRRLALYPHYKDL